MVLALLKDKQYRPMRFREMAGLLQVPRSERGELSEILDLLIREDKVSVDIEGRYVPVASMVAVGVFQATDRGYGFVSVEGEDEDWFIPAAYTLGAMHGDKVRVSMVRRNAASDTYGSNAGSAFGRFAKQGRRGKNDRTYRDSASQANGPRTEGRIVAILERNTTDLVGIFRKNKVGGRVIPDRSKCDFDVIVGPKDTLGAVSGQKVYVTITQYDGTHGPSGRITEILGHVNDPGVDILSVVRDSGIPSEWPEEVKVLSDALPTTPILPSVKSAATAALPFTLTVSPNLGETVSPASPLNSNGLLPPAFSVLLSTENVKFLPDCSIFTPFPAFKSTLPPA